MYRAVTNRPITLSNIYLAFLIFDVLYNLVYYSRCREEINLQGYYYKKRGNQNEICNFKENQ